MEHKIYTLNHQALLDNLYNIELNKIYNNEEDDNKKSESKKLKTLISIEKNLLTNYSQNIKKNHQLLSKSFNKVHSLLSDIYIKYKDKIIHYEHIIIYNNTIYVIEWKKSVSKQTRQLNKKIKILKNIFKKSSYKIKYEYYIVSLHNNKQYITYDKLEKQILSIDEKNNKFNYNEYIYSTLSKYFYTLSLEEYLENKYNIKIYDIKARDKKLITIIKKALLSKKSFLSSLSLFLYILIYFIIYFMSYKYQYSIVLSLITDLFYFALFNIILFIINKQNSIIKNTLLIFINCYLIFVLILSLIKKG